MTASVDVRKGKNLFHVEHIGDFSNSNDAAYVNRAMQQEIEERDKLSSATIQDWEDMGYMSPVDQDDFDDDDGGEAKLDLFDAMQIDSTDERRRQIDGFKAELNYNWREAVRAETLIGRGELAEFDPEILPLSEEPGVDQDQSQTGLVTRQKRFPEFTPNRQRDKPHSAQVRMNHILGLEASEMVFDAIDAY
ncbi:hypothetical protein F4859DRAFT_528942 [Xylaria cf. heliscus]|nr:hypothetical protein F4859DRAFT_528942 [Xylaria cf. heliscus]